MSILRKSSHVKNIFFLVNLISSLCVQEMVLPRFKITLSYSRAQAIIEIHQMQSPRDLFITITHFILNCIAHGCVWDDILAMLVLDEIRFSLISWNVVGMSKSCEKTEFVICP